ncbi:MAG: hypothetical protein ACXWZP_00695, partial [Gaiellaceae bacterium]
MVRAVVGTVTAVVVARRVVGATAAAIRPGGPGRFRLRLDGRLPGAAVVACAVVPAVADVTDGVVCRMPGLRG